MATAPDNHWISVAPERNGSRIAFEPRELYAAVLVAVGYYLGVHAGLALTFPSSPVSTLWPPNAILFAALLLTPPRLWWLMLAAVLPVHIAAEIALDVPFAMAALWFVSNVSEALLGAAVITKLLGGPPRLDRVRDVSVFLFAGVLLAPLVSSFLDAAFVALVGWRDSAYWEVWRVRVFSNSLATLILVPLIVIWFPTVIRSLRRATVMASAEFAALLAGVCVTSAVVFQEAFDLGTFATYPYLPLPLLIWAAVRFGVPGVSFCAAIVAAFAITGALNGTGPFDSGDPRSAAITTQTFLIIAEASLLVLAASRTELRQARVDAARQEESLTLALEAAEMGPWQWDFAADRVTWHAVQTVAGTEARSRSRSPGKLLKLVHENDRDLLRDVIDKARREGGSSEIECRFTDGHGGHRWLMIKGRVRADASGISRAMSGVYTDTTHRKSQELQARTQREQLAHLGRISILGELSGAIAHELNQPLTAILLNAQAALREVNNESADLAATGEMIEDIIAQDKRAAQVIRRLRALLVGGATEMQPVHLNECIEDVLGLERIDLIEHHVITDVHLQTGLPAVVGDRIQLQQVLLNLVANARDAMAEVDPGGRKLRIASAMSDGHIHVEIRDTGRGIPDTEAIFEPFFSTKVHGIGMGLAICRTIISAHGGRLWASNNSSPGATLHISMPIRASGFVATKNPLPLSR